MSDCIFCQIVSGEIPSHRIYEDESNIAFLGITPPVEGFTLVVPKKHTEEIWHMSKDDYLALMRAVRKVGQHLRKSFNTARVGIQVEGLEVPHTHVKVLPFNTAQEFRALEPGGEPDHEALAKIADKLRFENDTDE